jgi:hypothetical protein
VEVAEKVETKKKTTKKPVEKVKKAAPKVTSCFFTHWRGKREKGQIFSLCFHLII